jgi:transcriptional regulator with XRE-family HTH domain
LRAASPIRGLGDVTDVARYQRALAEAMKRHREARGRSQYDVADATGIGQDSLSAWETHRNWPRADLLLRWCHALDIAPSALYASAETILRGWEADGACDIVPAR